MVGKSYNWCGIARVLTREAARYRRVVARSVTKNRGIRYGGNWAPLNCKGPSKMILGD